MAHLDNLIESVKDPTLRAALHAEIDKVTKNRRLGLVFDRHLPESVTLPGFTIRQGEKVQVVTEGSDDPTDLDNTGIWTVIEMRPATAVLRDGAGQTREVPVSQLVATREFGDPIYPGLVSTGRVVRGGGTDGDDGGKPFHTVINAENFHALEALMFAYEGQVDAIYIDPPYNTGARDWKYNNDYVDDTDPYRHSKWLSFMEKRLQLAKRLLNPQRSVLVATIDEKEIHRLALLLEQIFPSASQQLVTIVINPNGAARKRELARVEEYAIFVFIGEGGPTPTADPLLGDQVGSGSPVIRWERLLRGGTGATRADRPNLFYPVYVDSEKKRVVEVGEPLSLDDDRTAIPDRPGVVTVWPLRTDGAEGRWRVSAASLRTMLDGGYAKLGAYDKKNDRYSLLYLGQAQIRRIQSGELEILGRDESGAVIVGASETLSNRTVAKTVWSRPAHKSGEYGSSLLKRFVPDRAFPFPKSLYAVEDTLRVMVGDNPDALIVDFFGGSGTTLHAAARLNREDSGRRRCILITNNEVSSTEATTLRAQGHRPGAPEWERVGICQQITVPRVRAALTGTTHRGDAVQGDYAFGETFAMADGLEQNAEFFDLTYEDAALVSLGRRFDAIAPLLWLRAGCIGARIDRMEESGWSLPADAVYGVLFDTTTWGAFVSAAAKREDLRHVFIVTDSIVEYQQIVAKLDPTLKTTRLYADYLRNFEINTRR